MGGIFSSRSPDRGTAFWCLNRTPRDAGCWFCMLTICRRVDSAASIFGLVICSALCETAVSRNLLAYAECAARLELPSNAGPDSSGPIAVLDGHPAATDGFIVSVGGVMCEHGSAELLAVMEGRRPRTACSIPPSRSSIRSIFLSLETLDECG